MDEGNETELFIPYNQINYCMHCMVKKQTPWPEPVSDLYRPSERHFSAKLVPTFADRGMSV
jgi:hypothetical protein